MAFQIKAKKRPWVGAPGYFRGATKFKAFCILLSLVFKKNPMKIGIIFIIIIKLDISNHYTSIKLMKIVLDYLNHLDLLFLIFEIDL